MPNTFIQSSQSTSASASSLAAAYTSNNVSGHLLTLELSWTAASSFDVTTVTDTGGNTWTRGHTTTVNGTESISTWYCLNAAGGANTVTASWGSNTVLNIAMWVTE